VFDKHKSEKTTYKINHIYYHAEKPTAQEKEAVAQGQAIANGLRLAKNLGNEPSNICTPTYLGEQAKQLAKEFSSIKTEVLDVAAMKKLGMGALLAVGQGSNEPPKLIVMNYQGGKKSAQPIALVGKGITFDAGGICIKPSASMDEMKFDMMGGATVMGVLRAIAELKLPINVVGIVPSAENMPDGKSYKPADIVTTMSGKTVNIIDTDAEGRLILCDALTYAAKFKPRTIIDIATLTGSIIVSLGFEISGIFANDDKLAKALVTAGEDICDRAWHMPLVRDYHEELKSVYADIDNCGSRWGGAITAACFLSNFTQNFSWAHIDNAGTAWKIKGDVGATGRPIALLVNYLLKQCEKN
jgi:leucyl aminopeptidase